tara:strand:+ start:475 stop:690 length:216 start_codon:yes stop_codon:yes gene_type:complete
MIGNKCLVCGGSNMRADRALSGRLVCNTCGTPFGVGRRVKYEKRSNHQFSLNKKYFIFICIMIFAFILVVI